METRLKTLLILLLIFFLVSYQFVDYSKLLLESFGMVMGRMPKAEEFTLLGGTLNVMALVVISMVISLIALGIAEAIIGRPEREVRIAIPTPLAEVSLGVFLEDLFARVLLFGLPLTLFGLNPITFYIFWLLSNSIWAWLHLYNYAPEDRHVLRILPQLACGLFIESYAYLKFGFWVCFAVHLLFDFTLFSMFGKEEFESSFFRNFPARLLGISLGLLMCGALTQSPYIQWLQGNFIAENITILSFVGFLLLVSNAINLICDIAGLDEISVAHSFIRSRELSFLESRIGLILIYFFGSILLAMIMLVVYWISSSLIVPFLNIFTSFHDVRKASIFVSLFLIVLLPLSSEERTPSGEFRSFLVSFPVTYLLFVFLTGFPFLEFLLCVALYFTLEACVAAFKLY